MKKLTFVLLILVTLNALNQTALASTSLTSRIYKIINFNELYEGSYTFESINGTVFTLLCVDGFPKVGAFYYESTENKANYIDTIFSDGCEGFADLFRKASIKYPIEIELDTKNKLISVKAVNL